MQLVRVTEGMRTVAALLHFSNVGAARVLVLRMLADIFPGQICAQAVNLALVVADEEDKVLRINTAHAFAVRKLARLQNLRRTRVSAPSPANY